MGLQILFDFAYTIPPYKEVKDLSHCSATKFLRKKDSLNEKNEAYILEIFLRGAVESFQIPAALFLQSLGNHFFICIPY